MNNFTKLSLLLVLLVGLWQPIAAQRSVGAPKPSGINGISAIQNQGGNRGTTCDTLSNLFVTDSALIYGITGQWGFVSGHNQYGDISKADLFTNTGSGQVTQALVAFARANFGNVNNTVRVSVWDDNGTAGAPGTVLGFQDVTISSVAPDVAAGNFSVINFTTPVNVTGNFYLGIQLTYRPNDTVALYTTETPRLAGAINTAWEQLSNATWIDYFDSWGFNTSHWTLPVVCPLAAAPVANFSGTPTTLTAGGSVNFTDLSSGTPTSWAWTFTGGTPASSSLQTPPAITYSTPGTYTVSLTATNGSGTDGETKTGYIQVNSAGGGGGTFVDCDTFANFDLSLVTPTLYTSSGWGYVSGHNFFGDSSKAELIGNSLPGSPVSGVVMFFEVAAASNATKAIRVKVWNNNGVGGLPGTVLATQSVTISSIAADIAANRPTVVNFTNPATPAGNYYIGISYQYAAGDTVALLTTTDGDVIPGTAYEQWNDGTWHAYSETPASWGFDLAHYIFPIQCATVPCPVITTAFTSTGPVCSATNGTITASPTGGVAPYTYSWSNSGNTATINNLAAGTYTVTVTDANGCTTSANRAITTTFPTIAANITTVPAVCTASNGSATAAPSGGTSPYTYVWSTGSNTAGITNRAAGTYTVTITDANGCTTTGTATITAGSGTLAVTAASTPRTCTATNGTATATVTGGTSPFTYAWSNGGNTATRTALTAGTYTVTVTDANGCSATASTTVTTSAGNLTASATATNATCGAAVGTATVTPAGGTAPFVYTWSNGGNTAAITGLLAGTYTVTVTDANGCSITSTATVANPGSPVLTNGTVTNVTCFGLTNASASVNVTGGTAPYTYLWSAGSTTATQSGLGVGSVTVTVTDASGCQGTRSITITGPSAALSATVTVNNNISCLGATNGSLTAAGANGTSPYTYAWSNGTNTATAAGLASGTYTVTVSDANGCTTTRSGTVLPPLNPVSVSVANAQTSACGVANASLTATPSSGAAPYTYTWNTTPVQNTQTANGLGAGVYRVTVTDGGGCTATGTGNVTEPGAPTVTTATTATTCNGSTNGTATASPTGGSGNYSYSWSSGSSSSTATGLAAGTYTVTVLDVTSTCRAIVSATVTQPDTIGVQVTQTNVTCPGGNNGVASVIATGGNGGYSYTWLTSPQQTGSTATNLAAGAVILQVTDNLSCSRNFTVTITQPNAINLNITKSDVTCNGANNGSAQVTATGGTGSFSYVWNTNPTQTGASASGLADGTYTVTAIDGAGCTATQSVTITEPAAITATTNVTSVDCFNGADGTASVSATGGTGGYTYVWSTSPIQNTATASNLAAGNYTVTVTDANNCSVVANATVTAPTLITVATTTTPVTCSGGSNGTATATASGGSGSYTYQWPSGNGGTVNNLAAGTYTVTVADANGCTVTAVATVAAASGFTASLTTTASSCQGNNDGSATVNLTGGTAPFTYAWSPSGSGSNPTGLAAGTYTVTVTDANGCTATATGTVASASGIVVNPTPNNATCNGGTDGGITITVSGGAGNYAYAWSNSTSNQNLANVAAGTYSVTVTDANGCSTVASNLLVGEASGVTVTVTTTPETASGASNGTAIATATGGTGLITYTWSNSSTGSNLSNLAPATYTVTATDVNGCSATASGTVSTFNGISNVGLIVSLNMYPNPTEGKINMNLTLAQPEAVVVEWYNAIGERVLTNSFDSSLNINHTFDLSNVAAGVYYARIQYAGQTSVERVVLNK